ncbi:MAG: hypothetical protein JEZ06_04355 [Anaerolineaceae bacterium]|nr:hypothetical protein [Anaerolineaceae bacterium]
MTMYTGEDSLLKGKISPKLAYSLMEYQEIFHAWFPETFNNISIHYDHIEPLPHYKEEKAICTSFSGGVDSFYTLWSHLPINQPIPQAQITHGIIVHGLDARLDRRKKILAAYAMYSKMFEELGLELIQASTNAYQFAQFRIAWTQFFAAPTLGIPLALSPWLQRFYIPSGSTAYSRLNPNSSSPVCDHLLSTDTTEIINHGTPVTRFEKISVLKDWSMTHHKLRVCSNKHQQSGVINCSSCNKCYRTMSSLDLLKAMPLYKNFSRKMNILDYIKWGAFSPMSIVYAKRLRKRSAKMGRLDITISFQIVIILQSTRKLFIKFIKKMISRELLYKIKRRIYHPEL